MKAKPLVFFSGLFIIFELVLLLCFLPSLKLKYWTQQSDRAVSLQVDFEDVESFCVREKREVHELLHSLRGVPIHVVSLNANAAVETEKVIRRFGYKILWRTMPEASRQPKDALGRLREGDGLLAYENVAVGYPEHLDMVAAALVEKNGFLPYFEFGSQQGANSLAIKIIDRVVKAHCLQKREVVFPKLDLWEARVLRAVETRWVRLIEIRCSPNLSWDDNIRFQSRVASALKARDFVLGPPTLRSFFVSPRPVPIKIKLGLIFFLAMMAPIFQVLVLKHTGTWPPMVSFLLVTFLSVFTGIAIHALGSDPILTFGIIHPSGIKIQLLAPLLLAFFLLIHKADIFNPAIWAMPTWAKIFVWGALFAFVGIYLMRSGNHPLIPVSDGERHLRDLLETWLVARPRMKEFAIGHPFMLLGLWLRHRSNGAAGFLRDGRLWIVLGMVGQISIMNTFQHFHAPLNLELLRSFHGIWLGCLFGWVLVELWKKLRWAKA